MKPLLFLIGLSFLSHPAMAEDIDQATLDAVIALATRGYANPGAAEVRNVHKSLARNGMGYCGEVSLESAGGSFTVFHAILEGDTAASVLRLVDYPFDPNDPN
ncbi:MAG TPA: hypothetical protein VFK86_14070, partial [Bauldia sp.]|nr:hypothetical protein [Bauldia sp.]